METKTAGVVVDNYKINKYKEELTKYDFTITSVTPFMVNTSTIRVELTEDRLPDLTKLCEMLEFTFKHTN